MSAKEILSVWAGVCKVAGMNWWLYKETLLCAVGYGYFSQEMKVVRVAIPGKSLPLFLENVMPILPGTWNVDLSWFAATKEPIVISMNNQVLMKIDVILDEETAEVDEIRGAYRRNKKLLNLLKRIAPKKFVAKLKKNSEKKAAKRFAATAVGLAEDGEWLWDGFTDKTGALRPRAWFENIEMITIREGEYPVPSGYRDYLRAVYFDYENGLFDEIGCGLTVEDKNLLREHQQHCKEALAFIQQLSQEFGLRYYLLAGSVLGPVRHGGFIPWDDDIDIGIRLEDLARFEELVEEYLPQRLPKGYSLKKPGVNSDYPRMFSKICYEGRCCMDLWPLIPTRTHGRRAKLLWKFGKVITKIHYKKIGYKVTRFKKIVKLVDPFLSDALVLKLARMNEHMFDKLPINAYINLYSIYTRKKETIRVEWLDAETTMSFDGLEVPVVGCTEAYLTHLYGNYMWRPAPWSRASRHVERF